MRNFELTLETTSCPDCGHMVEMDGQFSKLSTGEQIGVVVRCHHCPWEDWLEIDLEEQIIDELGLPNKPPVEISRQIGS